jgi:hypothetical protein
MFKAFVFLFCLAFFALFAMLLSERTRGRKPDTSSPLQVKGRLDNEAWVRNLFHKDESLCIGKIFEMLAPAAILAKTKQLRAESLSFPTICRPPKR